MIHFKTVKYQYGKIYFVYDEMNNEYYTTRNILNTYHTLRYYYDTYWIPFIGRISLKQFISDNVIIEYSDYEPNIHDIIILHNKIYKRLNKIYHLNDSL